MMSLFTCKTKPQVKCGILDVAKWSSMQSVCGAWRVATIMSLAALLMLLLLPRLTSAEEPLVFNLSLSVRMYAEQTALSKACEGAPLPPNTVSAGCAVRQPNGGSVLHMLVPHSFCDWEVMNTLGHEVLHAIGWSHSPGYIFEAKGGTHWTGEPCGFVVR